MMNLLAVPFIHKTNHAILKILFVQSIVVYTKMKQTDDPALHLLFSLRYHL